MDVAASSGTRKGTGRLQALSLLDRAFAAMTDEELATLVASLPEDHIAALDERGLQTPAGRVDGDPGTGDPAADDDDVIPLLGEPGQGAVAR